MSAAMRIIAPGVKRSLLNLRTRNPRQQIRAIAGHSFEAKSMYLIVIKRTPRRPTHKAFLSRALRAAGCALRRPKTPIDRGV